MCNLTVIAPMAMFEAPAKRQLRTPRYFAGRALRKESDSRRMVLEVVNDDWVFIEIVAEHLGRTKAGARHILELVIGDGQVEVGTCLRGGKITHRYRKRPPGFVQPLYETQFDARPLARCLGRGNDYTFYQQPGV